jgi:hypothetical protein
MDRERSERAKGGDMERRLVDRRVAGDAALGQRGLWVLALALLCVGLVVASTGTADATFPGDNGRIVLQGQTAQHGVQLYSADPVTGPWRRLTRVTGYGRCLTLMVHLRSGAPGSRPTQ